MPWTHYSNTAFRKSTKPTYIQSQLPPMGFWAVERLGTDKRQKNENGTSQIKTSFLNYLTGRSIDHVTNLFSAHWHLLKQRWNCQHSQSVLNLSSMKLLSMSLVWTNRCGPCIIKHTGSTFRLGQSRIRSRIGTSLRGQLLEWAIYFWED